LETTQHIRTVEALVEQWQTLSADIMPRALIQAFQQGDTSKMLLHHFGDVLHPDRQMLAQMKCKDNNSTGTILSLPGSVIHAGPAYGDFRAIMFFSAWPQSNETAPYDPDVQYTAVLLTGHFVNCLWRREGIEYPARLFLLQLLAQYVEGSIAPRMHAHFRPGPTSDFIRNIEEQPYKENCSREEHNQKVAQSLDMGIPGDPFSSEG
jgi:hypothetical protein